MRTKILALLLASAAAAACSGGASTPGTGGSGGGTVTHSSTSVTVSSTSAGGSGGCVDMGPVTTTFVPTASDIQFKAVNPVPQGEQIVFNDWNPSPNVLSTMTPDGATTTKLFEAYRLWSVGVSNAGDTIAFACGDPQQDKHYGGLALGDAIQHTWLYDVATQKPSLLSDGNVNDECHVFGPGDATLYICRRYDFTTCFADKGYRVGKFDLPGGAFTWLTPDDASVAALDPAPLTDGSAFLFRTQTLVGTSYQNDIQVQPLPTGTAMLRRAKAGTPVVSPDGVRYAFSDYSDSGNLWVSNLDGSGAKLVASERVNSPSWSPDGTKIAYLSDDAAANCQHIDVVMADGSTAATPTRVRDCALTGEFITAIAWFTR